MFTRAGRADTQMNTENNGQSIEDNKAELLERIAQEAQEALDVSIVGSKALGKSCCDCFDYACRLRTGEIIRFTDCTIISRDWVCLTLSDSADQPIKDRLVFPAPRGIDVRISDIVWVMDAPEGS